MFSLSSCDNEPLEGQFSDETGIGNSNVESIYDKWWYDSEDFTADIYFHSNGLYEQKIVLLGVELVSTGDWFWENESEGIIKVENLTGQGQVVPQAWFQISNIQDSSFNITQSTDGLSYSDARLYQDTDN